MRIAILGAGALGCTLGGTLAQHGHDVVLINRNAAVVDAITAHGLVLHRPGGKDTVALQAARSAAGLAPVDLLIVLVKSFHTDAALQGALQLCGPDTTVLSLQNGMGHEDLLSARVGRDRVIAGKTYVGGVMLAPGQVLANTEGKETYLGELDGGLSTRVLAIARAFTEAGLATTASTDIQGIIWDKLLVNVATGAVSAITRLPYGPLYRIPEIEATALGAVQEAMVVAAALGVTLSFESPRDAWLKAATGLSPDFRTSMLQSLEKGSVTEIDFINGAVVRAGRRCGVSTPINATLVACIKGIEANMTAGTRSTPCAYVEHVALRVRDIHWHIRFFREVLGMTMCEVDGPENDPRQYWTIGGLQFVATPGLEAAPSNDAGWLAHLGIMVDDLEPAIAAATRRGATPLPQGPNWLQLPDGLAIELIQAAPGSVRQALAVRPRG